LDTPSYAYKVIKTYIECFKDFLWFGLYCDETITCNAVRLRIWDLRFSHRWTTILWFCGLWTRVALKMVTVILEEVDGFLTYPEDGDSMFLRNFGIYHQYFTPSEPINLQSKGQKSIV